MASLTQLYGRKSQMTIYLERVLKSFWATARTDGDDLSSGSLNVDLQGICQEQYAAIFGSKLDHATATPGMGDLTISWTSGGIRLDYAKGVVTFSEVSGKLSRIGSIYSVANTLDDELSTPSLDEGLQLQPHGAFPTHIVDSSFNVVYGGPGSGKTLLTAALAASSATEGPYISVGEPYSQSAGDVQSIIVMILACGLTGLGYLYVDSLRTVINEMDGKLRQGGLAREFDTIMTLLSAISMRARVHVHGVINPSDSKPEVVSAMQSNIRGAVTSLITVNNVTSRNGAPGILTFSTEVESRTSSRKECSVRLNLANSATVGIIDGADAITESIHITTINDI